MISKTVRVGTDGILLSVLLNDDLVIDRQNTRIVARPSELYMTFSLFDREENEWTFTLSDAAASPIFVARVKRHGFGEDPISGGATNVTYIVTEFWFPQNDGNEPERFYGDSMWMDVLARFLAVHKYFNGVKIPDPTFAFEDSRQRGASK